MTGRASTALCVLTLAVAAACGASPMASGGGSWPMYRADLARDGRAAAGGLTLDQARHLTQAWQEDLGGPVDGTPAVADGMVVVGSESGRLEALEERSGRPVWKVTGLGSVTASPAIAGGLVVVGDLSGKVSAYRLASGQHVWTWKAPGDRPAIWSSPTIWQARVLVATSSQYGDAPLEAGRLAALDLAGGRLDWVECLLPRCRAGDGIWSTPAIDATGLAFVGVGNPDDGIVAFEAATGRILWRHSFYADQGRDLDVGAAPVLVSRSGVESLYVGSTAGLFESLAAADGRLIWSRPLDQGSAVHGLIGSPAFDGARLYIPSASDPLGVIAVSAAGAVAWQASTPLPVYDSPALGDGVLIFGTGPVFGDRSAGDLLAVDTATGSTVWRAGIGSAVNSSPAIASGFVFVGDYAGDLLAFSAAS